jgi:hypothetical protein
MHTSCAAETSVTSSHRTLSCHIPKDKCSFTMVSKLILAHNSNLFLSLKMLMEVLYYFFYPDLTVADNSHANHIEYFPTNEPQGEARGIN